MKTIETIKVRIQNGKDREAMVIALAAAGYKVWNEEKELDYSGSGRFAYYVCFEYLMPEAIKDINEEIPF